MYKYIPMQAQGYTYKDYFTYKCCQAFKAELNEENNRIVADGNSPSHNNLGTYGRFHSHKELLVDRHVHESLSQ
eukprot:c27912_g2_i1 orf=25-246(+)